MGCATGTMDVKKKLYKRLPGPPDPQRIQLYSSITFTQGNYIKIFLNTCTVQNQVTWPKLSQLSKQNVLTRFFSKYSLSHASSVKY